jgi:hypothetical protein
MNNIRKKALTDALLAEVYIIIVVLIIRYIGEYVKPEETIIGPIAFLSLFVLSAAVMGFLFVFKPLQLFLEGQKKEAVNMFLSTVAAFSILTGAVIAVLILSSTF